MTSRLSGSISEQCLTSCLAFSRPCRNMQKSFRLQPESPLLLTSLGRRRNERCSSARSISTDHLQRTRGRGGTCAKSASSFCVSTRPKAVLLIILFRLSLDQSIFSSASSTSMHAQTVVLLAFDKIPSHCSPRTGRSLDKRAYMGGGRASQWRQ